MTTDSTFMVQTAFREAMAAVCSPVAVITALHDGLPYGTTVSAFTSLSMDPPMVLISLDRRSELLRVLNEADRFGVNVLSSRQAAVAANFATKGGTSKFAQVAWEIHGDVPHLPDTAGFVACTIAGFTDGGDHVIVLGDVVIADAAEMPPLTYHRRTFGTHAAIA